MRAIGSALWAVVLSLAVAASPALAGESTVESHVPAAAVESLADSEVDERDRAQAPLHTGMLAVSPSDDRPRPTARCVEAAPAVALDVRVGLGAHGLRAPPA